MNRIRKYCEKYNIDWKFVNFLLVGGLNAVFGYSIFALFNFIGLHYTLSTFLATIAGILFNFKTTGYIVFKNNNNKLLLKFLLVYCFACILTIFLLFILKKIGMLNMYINYLILLPFGAVISYKLMQKFVFNTVEDEL